MIRFRKAILIIHGFTGNLYDNEYLMNYLQRDLEFDVYAKTLPGHNKDRFSSAKYTDWINFVDEEIKELLELGYKSIYIVGHSMGGVLASYLASKYKQVKKLVLINAAFDYINFSQNKVDILEHKDLSKYTHILEKVLRTSLLFFIEFTKLVKEYKHVITSVKCKTLILRSTDDEVVPYDTADYIYNNIGTDDKWITDLVGCSHIPLIGDKKAEISEYIRIFFKSRLKWQKNKKKEL